MHPRNRNADGYDFPALLLATPGLKRFVITTQAGTPSIDFANPAAVKALNRAILLHNYGIHSWTLPAGYLCPPIPGRADYIHAAADLLASDNAGTIPTGKGVHALDIGVGANCIYPLLGHAEYGWHFVGSDIDKPALLNARQIVHANAGLTAAINLRHQPFADDIFRTLLRPGEYFDITLCNPPFHASPSEVSEVSQRKWHKLGKPGASKASAPHLNFGGQGCELWCPGGERAFLATMIEQSATIPKRCLWFTSLLSKADNLPHIEADLKKTRAIDVRIIPMAQGQKHSRLVAWTFQSKAERQRWREKRWQAEEMQESRDQPAEAAMPAPDREF